MITAISAIIVFLLLITVHELGHFLAAKAVGIRVLEFAIGMGPAIFKKQKGETLYSVRILPIGGYCKMEGEDEDSEDERAFGNKNAWKRLVTLVAGAFMNILTGFVIFILLLSTQPKSYTPVIAEVIENSPAQQAGLIAGDRITSINGTKINISEDFHFEMSRQSGGEIKIGYIRDGVKNYVTLSPALTEGRYIIGFKEGVKDFTFTERMTDAFYYTLFTSKVIIVSLGDLITGHFSVRDMSGPVGIVQHIGTAAKAGMLELMSLTALITINLGIFNLLPLPALDGGRIFFILIEAVRRKKIPADKEGFIHLVGFVLLILLMIFATTNDFSRIFGG